jgi:hypothetical protein
MRGNCTALMSSAKIPRTLSEIQILGWHLHVAVQIAGQCPHELQSRKTGPLY